MGFRVERHVTACYSMLQHASLTVSYHLKWHDAAHYRLACSIVHATARYMACSTLVLPVLPYKQSISDTHITKAVETLCNLQLYGKRFSKCCQNCFPWF